MTSLYGDNKHKLKGIQQQPYVIKKILIFLRSTGFKVKSEPATFEEDTKAKIDYFLKFDKTTPFMGHLIVPIDVKYAQSYTIISDTGINVLEKSKAAYAVLNNPKYERELL